MLNGIQFCSDWTAIVSLDLCLICNLYWVEAERIFSASASWLLTQCFTDVWPLVFNVIMRSQPTKTQSWLSEQKLFFKENDPQVVGINDTVYFFFSMPSHIKCQRPGNGSRMVGKYKRQHVKTLNLLQSFTWEKNSFPSLGSTPLLVLRHLPCPLEFSCIAVMRLDMFLSPAPINSIYCPH